MGLDQRSLDQRPLDRKRQGRMDLDQFLELVLALGLE